MRPFVEHATTDSVPKLWCSAYSFVVVPTSECPSWADASASPAGVKKVVPMVFLIVLGVIQPNFARRTQTGPKSNFAYSSY